MCALFIVTCIPCAVRPFAATRKNNGDYHRIIPDVKGQAAGDVELCFNTVTPWDESDPAKVLAPKDAQIVSTGPKFMIVHIGNTCIDMDITVAHAPPFLGYQALRRGGSNNIRILGGTPRGA